MSYQKTDAIYWWEAEARWKMTNNLLAQYSKFIASLAGLLVTYLQMYGATWHLVPAVTAIGAALAVMGVPNRMGDEANMLNAIRLGMKQPAVMTPPSLVNPQMWPGNRPPGTQ